MNRHMALIAGVAAVPVVGTFTPTTRKVVAAAQGAVPDVPVVKASISGVVLNSGTQLPEAGVWVIAETTSLPTPYRRIVVTDDLGRFLVPDLPDGAYQIWVRGYGLRDSTHTKATRGARVDLKVESAKDPQEAAKIYPASYWFSLLQAPPKEKLKAFNGQGHWTAELRSACGGHCHSVGTINTRLWTTPEQWDLTFNRHRGMRGEAGGLDMELFTSLLADWASRTWAGEVPPAPPRRPASNAISS